MSVTARARVLITVEVMLPKVWRDGVVYIGEIQRESAEKAEAIITAALDGANGASIVDGPRVTVVIVDEAKS